MKRSQFTIHNSQFAILLGLLLLLLSLLTFGHWRATATGPQVQVPMFYDAHYLYPRPWTQAQEAPGVPEPFPVTFYGANQISQSFVSGANYLAAVEIWLHAAPAGRVVASLADEHGWRYEAEFDLSGQLSGDFVRLTFPPYRGAAGRRFSLTLTAPDAAANSPAITRVVGGDRLGGVLRLNEYPRPGNLQLRTYVTGTAVPAALAEQLLPDLFRQRLQQYKPPFVKGETFAVLLLLTAGLSVGLLVLSRPSGQKAGPVSGWLLAGLLLGGLVWQVGTGRVTLSFLRQSVPLAAKTAVTPPFDAQSWRVVHDLTAVLWTAQRLPEERLIATQTKPFPGMRVPAVSSLGYALDVPLHGRLRAGLQAAGAGTLRMQVTFNGEMVRETAVAAGGQPIWLELDLTPWQGQGGVLRLLTEPIEGTPDGLWLMPQISAPRSWLLAQLPETAVPAGHHLGDGVVLAGYQVEPKQPSPGEVVVVTLYWLAERPLAQNGIVFVHALNAAGETVAQSDGQPVQNSYPLITWPPGLLVTDVHQFVWPDESNLERLAVGLYDPASLARFPVHNPDGAPDPDGRALLPVRGRP